MRGTVNRHLGHVALLVVASAAVALAQPGVTMGPARAAEAVALVQPAKVSPMHYGTFPVLNGSPSDFVAALKAKGLFDRYQPLQLHETLEL